MIDIDRIWPPQLGQVEVPAFVLRLKEINQRFGQVDGRRKALLNEARMGTHFFAAIDFESNIPEVKSQIQSAFKKMIEIESELIELDNEFRDMVTECTMIMENQFAPIAFRIFESSGKATLFEPWPNYVDKSELVTIHPENLWFLQIAKKLFNADPTAVIVDRRSVEKIGLKP